jgi:hypothetical protein
VDETKNNTGVNSKKPTFLTNVLNNLKYMLLDFLIVAECLQLGGFLQPIAEANLLDVFLTWYNQTNCVHLETIGIDTR